MCVQEDTTAVRLRSEGLIENFIQIHFQITEKAANVLATVWDHLLSRISPCQLANGLTGPSYVTIRLRIQVISLQNFIRVCFPLHVSTTKAEYLVSKYLQGLMIPGLLFQQSPLWFDCSHHSQRGQLISDVRDAAATQRPPVDSLQQFQYLP